MSTNCAFYGMKWIDNSDVWIFCHFQLEDELHKMIINQSHKSHALKLWLSNPLFRVLNQSNNF